MPSDFRRTSFRPRGARSGSVAVTVTVMFTALVGFAGLGTDVVLRAVPSNADAVVATSAAFSGAVALAANVRERARIRLRPSAWLQLLGSSTGRTGLPSPLTIRPRTGAAAITTTRPRSRLSSHSRRPAVGQRAGIWKLNVSARAWRQKSPAAATAALWPSIPAARLAQTSTPRTSAERRCGHNEQM